MLFILLTATALFGCDGGERNGTGVTATSTDTTAAPTTSTTNATTETTEETVIVLPRI